MGIIVSLLLNIRKMSGFGFSLTSLQQTDFQRIWNKLGGGGG